jgi:ribonuclease HI/ASC-1-like (ASCH) protein
MTIEKHLSEPWFSLMENGSKTVEGRLATGLWKDIVAGTQLIFFNVDTGTKRTVSVSITFVETFPSFFEMLQKYLKQCLPSVKDIEEGIEIYRKYYDLSVDHPVVALHITRNPIYILHFDGCSKGNPGISGAGAVIYLNGVEVWAKGFYVGTNRTNNEAEYMGLIYGLEQASLFGIQKIHIRGDSLLVIQQMKKIYQVKSSNLRILYSRAQGAASKFHEISYEHVLRGNNTRADELCNESLVKNSALDP